MLITRNRRTLYVRSVHAYVIRQQLEFAHLGAIRFAIARMRLTDESLLPITTPKTSTTTLNYTTMV